MRAGPVCGSTIGTSGFELTFPRSEAVCSVESDTSSGGSLRPAVVAAIAEPL
jgi:hypothetical protein